MGRAQANAGTMAANFVAEYGRPGLKRFLQMLREEVSGELIAREFNVSRERVRQWKNAFGRVVYSYEPSPEIRRLAGLKQP